MEFIWSCMILSLKVTLGTLGWAALLILIALILFGIAEIFT